MFGVRSALLIVFIETVLVLGEYIAENEGDACETERPGVAGTCRFNCAYATKLINVEKRRPNLCSANDTHYLACCPNDDPEASISTNIFLKSMNGFLSSGDIECRYDGKLPLVCCKSAQVPDVRIDRRLSKSCAVIDPKFKKPCIACTRYSTPRTTKVCPQEIVHKISNGLTVDIQEFPHMAVLGRRNLKKKSAEEEDIAWVAGGTLISETFVLTAAHVLSNDIQYVLLGATDKLNITQGYLGNVKRSMRYKLYTAAFHDHDLALMELFNRVPITSFIRPACLPLPGMVPQEKNEMMVAGWGRIAQYEHTSRFLQMGTMTVQPHDICLKALQSSKQLWNSSIFICAQSESGDTCRGDSGGPLMLPMDQTVDLCGFIVMGVVSFAPQCGENFPGAFVNLAFPSYLKWITQSIWKS